MDDGGARPQAQDAAVSVVSDQPVGEAAVELPARTGRVSLVKRAQECLSLPRFEEDPRYLEACEFRQSFSPIKDRDYSFSISYAKSYYESQVSLYKDMDSKADGIIKYLGGGVGVATLSLVLKVHDSTPHLALSFLPSILTAIVGIALAVSVRSPGEREALPQVQAAVEYDETFTNGEAAFLGQIHQACESLRLTNGVRANRIQLASALYVTSVILLLVPVIVSLLV